MIENILTFLLLKFILIYSPLTTHSLYGFNPFFIYYLLLLKGNKTMKKHMLLFTTLNSEYVTFKPKVKFGQTFKMVDLLFEFYFI